MRTDTNTETNPILSDTEYKASIIEKIQQVITDSLKTNKDIQKSQQRNRLLKKKQIKIVELKNTITEINSVGGPSSEVEITEDGIR